MTDDEPVVRYAGLRLVSDGEGMLTGEWSGQRRDLIIELALLAGNMSSTTERWISCHGKMVHITTRGNSEIPCQLGRVGRRGKPKLVLIHGFGASVYHFRNQLAVLGRDYRVFAFDMVGLGLSDKPLVDYHAELWRDQALAFVEEVVMKKMINLALCVVTHGRVHGFICCFIRESR